MNRRAFLIGTAASAGALATVSLAAIEPRVIAAATKPYPVDLAINNLLHPNCRCTLAELERYNAWGYAEGQRAYDGAYNWRRA